MKSTDNYSIPYPECDPPLVKDSSQIVQFQQQALAVDTAVRSVFDAALNDLIDPPTTRATIAVLPVATTDNLAVPFFDTNVFTSPTWGGSALTTEGGLHVYRAGWYLAGGHALVTSATAAVLPMVRLAVNGTPASSWSAAAGNYGVLNGRLATLNAVPLLLSAEDVIRLEIKHVAAGSPAWDYRPHIWAVRMEDPT